MVRHKWIIGVRNKLASFYEECDSCAAIEGAQMTEQEREELKKLLEAPYKYIIKKTGTLR